MVFNTVDTGFYTRSNMSHTLSNDYMAPTQYSLCQTYKLHIQPPFFCPLSRLLLILFLFELTLFFSAFKTFATLLLKSEL